MMRTIEVRSKLEAILIEQAIAMARELERVADAAPDGHALAIAERGAIRAGCKLTRVDPEATLQRQSAPAKKKGLPAAPVPAAERASSRIKRRAKR